jgi:hypothetical protein
MKILAASRLEAFREDTEGGDARVAGVEARKYRKKRIRQRRRRRR